MSRIKCGCPPQLLGLVATWDCIRTGCEVCGWQVEFLKLSSKWGWQVKPGMVWSSVAVSWDSCGMLLCGAG